MVFHFHPFGFLWSLALMTWGYKLGKWQGVLLVALAGLDLEFK